MTESLCFASWTKWRIPHMGKVYNPSIAPEIRPIEQYWFSLKNKVHDGSRIAGNLKQLIRRTRKCLWAISNGEVRRLLGHIKRDIRRAKPKAWRKFEQVNVFGDCTMSLNRIDITLLYSGHVFRCAFKKAQNVIKTHLYEKPSQEIASFSFRKGSWNASIFSVSR